jgi:hypothetical protein
VELVSDIVFLAITVGFFALAALLVGACDRIIGDDEPSDTFGPEAATDPTPDEAATPAGRTAR